MEKPFTLTAAEAKPLAELAAKAKRILQVGHVFRFDPATACLRTLVRRGECGGVRMLRGRFSGLKRPRADSGVMLADAIHLVDLFNYLLDAIPKTALAIHHDFLGRGMEDAALLSLEYETPHGPVWATVESDCFHPQKLRGVAVIGDRNSAICDFTATERHVSLFPVSLAPPRDSSQGGDEGFTRIMLQPVEPLREELAAFLRSIETREAPLADAWAGYNAARVMDAAYESVRLGKAVGL